MTRSARSPSSPVVLASALALLAPGLGAQQDTFSLDGLVVTASPLPRPVESVAGHVTVLTADDLSAHGDRTLGEALRGVAGVDVVRNGSFGGVTSVFLRGGESDHTLVLVDGVQVNQAGGGFDFATLTTDNVERVEILRGPASALYGSDAVAGVIHVVTRTGRGAARGTIGMQAGTFGRQDVSATVEAGTDRAAYALSLARRTTDGILPFNNDHRTTVMSGRARFLPDDHTELGVVLRASGHEAHFPTDRSGVPVDRNAFTFGDGMVAQLTVARALSRRVRLSGLVGLNETDGGTDDAQDTPADTLGFYAFSSFDHFRRASGELRAHVEWGPALVTSGIEIERETQRSFTESGSQFGPSNGRSSFERDNRAGFVHAVADARALSLSAGVRLEDNERFGSQATWQAGISWLVSTRARTRVRASAGRAIKEPTFFEAFATGFARGNPDLVPERSLSWEVGIEQTLAGGRLTVRGTLFDQRFEDLIQYTSAPPTPADPSFFNVAAASSRGLEVDLGARLGVVTAGLEGTWLDTEVTDSGFDEGPGASFVEGEALLRRPRGTLAARASVRPVASTRLFGRAAFTGVRSDRDFSTFPATAVELQAHVLLTIGTEVSLDGIGLGLSPVSLTLRGENLLDADYEEVLGFGAPGRAVYVGASVAVGGSG